MGRKHLSKKDRKMHTKYSGDFRDKSKVREEISDMDVLVEAVGEERRHHKRKKEVHNE